MGIFQQGDLLEFHLGSVWVTEGEGNMLNIIYEVWTEGRNIAIRCQVDLGRQQFNIPSLIQFWSLIAAVITCFTCYFLQLCVNTVDMLFKHEWWHMVLCLNLEIWMAAYTVHMYTYCTYIHIWWWCLLYFSIPWVILYIEFSNKNMDVS